MSKLKIGKCFEELVQDSYDLYLDNTISTINYTPTALEFHRDYVSNNRPLLIKNGCKHFIANYLWNNEYLKNKMKNKMITIAITPNGKADSVYNNKYFIEPIYKKIKFNDFMNYLENYDEHINQAKKNKKCIKQKEFKFVNCVDDIKNAC